MANPTFLKDNSTPSAPATDAPFSPASINKAYDNFVQQRAAKVQADNPPVPAPPVKDSTIKEQFQSGTNKMNEGFDLAVNAKNAGQLIGASIKLGSGAVTQLTSPLAPVLSPIGHAVNAFGNWLAGFKPVQNFANSPAGERTSKTADVVGDLSNISGFMGTGGEGAPKAVDAATAKLQSYFDARDAGNLETATKKVVTPSLKDAQAEPFPTIPTDENGNPVSPKNASGQTIPRTPVDDNGVIGVNNNRLELDAQAEGKKSPAIQELIKRNPNPTHTEMQNVIQPEIKMKDANLVKSLADTKIKTRSADVRSFVADAINQVIGKKYNLPEYSPVVQDYLKMFDENVRALGKKPGSAPGFSSSEVGNKELGLDDVYKLKQAQTKAYIEKQGTGKLGSQTVADPQLKGLDVIEKVANQAFIDYLDEQAPDAGVKAQLKSAADLHNFNDMLNEKKQGELETPLERIMGQFSKNHPTISRFGGYGVRRTLFKLMTHL